MSFLEDFGANILVAALKNPEVKKLLDKSIDEIYEKIKVDAPEYLELFKTKLMPELMAFFKSEVLPSVLAVLPTFGEAIIKSVFDKVPSLPNASQIGDVAGDIAGNILNADPDIPVVSEYFDLSEILHNIFDGVVRRQR